MCTKKSNFISNFIGNLNNSIINYPTIWPQFFTASIHQKFHLLKEDDYKDTIIYMPLAGNQAVATL
jgi:hypothetical protein